MSKNLLKIILFFYHSVTKSQQNKNNLMKTKLCIKTKNSDFFLNFLVSPIVIKKSTVTFFLLTSICANFFQLK